MTGSATGSGDGERDGDGESEGDGEAAPSSSMTGDLAAGGGGGRGTRVWGYFRDGGTRNCSPDYFAPVLWPSRPAAMGASRRLLAWTEQDGRLLPFLLGRNGSGRTEMLRRAFVTSIDSGQAGPGRARAPPGTLISVSASSGRRESASEGGTRERHEPTTGSLSLRSSAPPQMAAGTSPAARALVTCWLPQLLLIFLYG